MALNDDPNDASKLTGYWEALGRFIHYYSRVENTMKITLRLVTETSEETARAVFSGVRVRDGIKYIRRTLNERGNRVPLRVDEAFERLSAITTARDRILHYGIQFDDDGDWVTDELFQVSATAKKTPISAKAIRDMANDTIVIWARLVVYNRQLLRGPRPANHPKWVGAGRRSWRYKPPQPVRGQGKTRATKPK